MPRVLPSVARLRLVSHVSRLGLGPLCRASGVARRLGGADPIYTVHAYHMN